MKFKSLFLNIYSSLDVMQPFVLWDQCLFKKHQISKFYWCANLLDYCQCEIVIFFPLKGKIKKEKKRLYN